jgi:hypothetical protein
MTPMTPNNLHQLGRTEPAFLMRRDALPVAVSRVIVKRFHYDTTLTHYDTGASTRTLRPR